MNDNGNYEISIATHENEFLRCFDVLKELRPDLKRDGFLERIQRQRDQGYILAFLAADEKVHSVTGYRFLEFLPSPGLGGRITRRGVVIGMGRSKRIGF